jgi:hypothetical protein
MRPTRSPRRAPRHPTNPAPRLEVLEDRLTPTVFSTPLLSFTGMVPTSGGTFAVVSPGVQNFWTLADPSHFANINSLPGTIISIYDRAPLLIGDITQPPVATIPISAVPVTTTTVVTTVVTDHATNVRFVSAMFQVVLGRPVDAAGLSFFTGLLDGGVSQFAVATRILSSPEFLGLQVQAAFRTFLHRDVDPLGFGFFTGFLAAGHSTNELAAQLVASPEFAQNFGTTDGAFLNAVFQNALGRPVDSIGLSFFGSALATGSSRAAVAVAVFNSTEFLSGIVDNSFLQFLGRGASALELEATVAGLLQGSFTQQQFVAGLLTSAEFAERFGI